MGGLVIESNKRYSSRMVDLATQARERDKQEGGGACQASGPSGAGEGSISMAQWELEPMKRRLWRLWVLSPERLWLLSTSLRSRRHQKLAFWIKHVNSFMYHNSLAPGSSVSPDIHLGHKSFGIVINHQVVIGRRVKIWHNVTITTRSPNSSAARVIIEDDVMIGANAVVLGPRGRSLVIGRGARIGAGVVVTGDVPARATVVGAPPRVLIKDEAAAMANGAGWHSQ